jgi:CO dehydrogenase maturation factor
MAVPATRPYPNFWKTVGSRPAPRRPGVVADVDWAPGERPLRVVVVGKGGAGKSVIAGTMARLLARRGRRVLALDTDTMPGLALSLGVRAPATPPLVEAVERAEAGCWRLKKGVGAVRAVQRYSTPAPDGVRVLEVGDHPAVDARAVTPSVQAFYQVIHSLPEAKALRDWTMIGDHPAGPRQAVHDWAPYADTLVIVAEPTWKSALTARRLVEIAGQRETGLVMVASKVRSPADVDRVAQMTGEPVTASVPADDAVAASDRLGVALIDHAPDSPAVRAIDDLVEGLVQGTLAQVTGR